MPLPPTHPSLASDPDGLEPVGRAYSMAYPGGQ